MMAPSADPGGDDVAGTSQAPGDAASDLTQRSTQKAVRKDIKAGREADAKGQTLEAAFVRRLVLEADAPSGVRSRGARIEGVLDLQNARGAAGEPAKRSSSRT